MSHQRILIMSSLALSLAVFLHDSNVAFAQFPRSQIPTRGGEQIPRPRGGGFYGGYGGGFGIPIIRPLLKLAFSFGYANYTVLR